jgi:hypothetical protein
VSLSSESSHWETSGPARLGVSHQETERQIPIKRNRTLACRLVTVRINTLFFYRAAFSRYLNTPKSQSEKVISAKRAAVTESPQLINESLTPPFETVEGDTPKASPSILHASTTRLRRLLVSLCTKTPNECGDDQGRSGKPIRIAFQAAPKGCGA